MSDLVERLRFADDPEEAWLLRIEAADEIKRLREVKDAAVQQYLAEERENDHLLDALEQIANSGNANAWAAGVAREALNHEKET